MTMWTAAKLFTAVQRGTVRLPAQLPVTAAMLANIERRDPDDNDRDKILAWERDRMWHRGLKPIEHSLEWRPDPQQRDALAAEAAWAWARAQGADDDSMAAALYRLVDGVGAAYGDLRAHALIWGLGLKVLEHRWQLYEEQPHYEAVTRDWPRPGCASLGEIKAVRHQELLGVDAGDLRSYPCRDVPSAVAYLPAGSLWPGFAATMLTGEALIGQACEAGMFDEEFQPLAVRRSS